MTSTSNKPELAAPTLAQSHKSGINITSAAHLLIGVAPYPGMDEGDLIELYWDNCYVFGRDRTLDAKGFATVSGAAPGPARVMFGKDPADTWSDGSYIGKPEWPLQPPGAEDIPGPVQAMVAQVLPSKNWDVLETGKSLAQSGMSAVQTVQGAMQTAQQIKGAAQGGVAGLPKLASAAMPSASSLLGGASKSGRLPTLPAPKLPKPSLKTPGLLAGEMLS